MLQMLVSYFMIFENESFLRRRMIQTQFFIRAPVRFFSKSYFFFGHVSGSHALHQLLGTNKGIYSKGA